MVATRERDSSLQEVRTAVGHMAAYGIGNILVRALGFLMIPFYTHYLSPKDYGVLEILDQSSQLIALILSMGMAPALLRAYAAADTEEKKRRVISTSSIFSVVVGCAIFLLALGTIGPAARLLLGPTVSQSYVLLAFGGLVLSYMVTPARTYLRALDKAGIFSILDTVSALMLLVLNIVFIAGFRFGPAGVLLSSVTVNALQLCIVAGWAFHRAGFAFAWSDMAGMLRFGAPLIYANVGLFVLNFSDRFFLQHLRSLADVGIYALGYRCGYMMNALVVNPFFVMWQSRMYNIHARPDHRRIFKEMFALYSAGLIFIGLAMSLFSTEVIRAMVEPRFAASVSVIPVVVAAYVWYGLSYFVQVGLFLTGNTKALGIIGVAAAAVNLILNYALIAQFGMMGAAVATVLSFAFLAVVSYWRSQVVFPLPFDLTRMGIQMALATAVFLACRWWLPVSGVAIVFKSIVLATYLAAVWYSGLLDPGAAATLVSAKASLVAAAKRRLRLGTRYSEVESEYE